MSRALSFARPPQSPVSAATMVIPRDLLARPPRTLSADRRRQLVRLLSGARRTLAAAFLMGLTVLWSVPAHAQGGRIGQSSGTESWLNSANGVVEIRPYAGAFIPTGPSRAVLKNALLAGGQVSVRILPELAATGTFGWTPNNDRTFAGAPTLDVYQYDVGLEARGAGWIQGNGWDFTPFVGIGGGGRTYSYRSLSLSTTTDVDGYGALGGELGFGRLGLRVEGRDYISQYHPLNTVGRTTNHNDVMMAAGLRVRL